MMGDRQERNGALRGIRTPDLLVRSQLLYPAELGAHAFIEDNNAGLVRQFALLSLFGRSGLCSGLFHLRERRKFFAHVDPGAAE